MHYYFVIQELLEFSDLKSYDYLYMYAKDNLHYLDYLRCCLSSSKLKSIYYLFKIYILGHYKKYRGESKRFLLDIIYILINNMKDYQYNLEEW